MKLKTYSTLYADPPWMEQGAGQFTRGAQKHYPLMKTDAICRLEIDGVHVKWQAKDDAHLYLWVTNNFLPDGLRVMEAWGFEYKTMITWAKDRIGIGQYFRGQTEHVLFGVRGNIPFRVESDGARCQGSTLLYADRTEHSKKPEAMRKMIERVSPGPYLEIFARSPEEGLFGAPDDGWSVWGNEA